MTTEKIKVPDLGGADEVEVIEVCVSAGDTVAEEDSLLVLESDKASMEIPSPMAGRVMAVLVNEGDNVTEGSVILEIETEGASSEPAEAAAPAAPEPEVAKAPVAEAPAAASSAAESSVEQIDVPDIGGDNAEVIEVCVAEGDSIDEGDSLIVLESDKASMEVPAPKAGIVRKVIIVEGTEAGKGTPILELEVTGGVAAAPVVSASAPISPAQEARQVRSEPPQVAEQHQPVIGMSESRPTGDVYAGPAVRKMAREIGLDLALVPGTGPRSRIQKSDVKAFIKSQLAGKRSPAPAATGGSGIPAVPEIDFSQFGEVSVEPLTKLHKITAANMHRSWLNVPHVTAFDDVDITDLEEFRQQLKKEAEKAGVKITPLPFLLKACAAALKKHPKLNASLHANGEDIVYKQYVNIGMAVDTPAGLMVPVIRDVDKKSIFELAAETAELAQKAKERKLKPAEMQGGSFTISSLGPMGGTGFTPIVNTPEVAILGVSKLDIKPRWNGSEFEPRKMLPISLSYDHRAVNGADAGRFMVDLNALLADVRRLAL
ncbi:Dihydrolipoyllysine-residue acetyltransferase component of pyruvate dehydrogenase complex [BD1-7 clade bacterium]|uniref:Acetyltransferase component of pyruvate dehydrogenase complex n=1 Tax=BD1-7 clade bacterium TaxID=2029982 RepID=A0A5S9MYS1_9GAMM|nr:Dihydrolipoyllysine-residue acetyltransferase component of pyruvate dehydrogenase complex [BD1-7 clade bacterium]